MEEEEKELKRLEEHYSVLNSDEVSLTTQIRETDAELGRIKDELGQTEAQIEEYGSRIASCKVEIEKLTRELAQLQERRRDAGDELDAITASLGETRDLLMVQFGVEVPELYDHPRLPRPQALVAIEELDKQLADLGTVNLKAGEEYKEINNRIQLLSDEKRDIESAITELLNSKELIEKEIQQKFLDTFQKVAQSYEDIFQGLFGGGRGRLVLDEDTYGVEVVAEPPGRKQKQFNSLSGGERSLCGIALILSILSVKASPIIVLDEVDTSLDESNVIRFGQFLKKYAQDTQFLIITHQKSTMEIADVIYGVTMDEPGVSKVFGVSLQNR